MAETIIGFATQSDEAVTLPFYLEQAGGSLVVARTRNATLLGCDQLAADQPTYHVILHMMRIETYRRNHSDLFLKQCSNLPGVTQSSSELAATAKYNESVSISHN